MAIQNRQLTGNNLCDIPCTDKEKIIHPETCTEAVLMECENQDNFSLKDWILGGLGSTPTFHNSLKAWLQEYYHGNVTFDLDPATYGESAHGTGTLGGVIIEEDSGLSIDEDGYLSVNLPVATTSAQGIVQIGDNLNVNNGTISVPIANHIYPVTERQNPYAPGVVAINNVIKELKLNYNNPQDIDGVTYYTLGSTSATNNKMYAIPIDIVATPSDDPNVDDYRIFAPIPIDLFEYNNIRNAPSLAYIEYTTNKVTSFSNTPSNTKYPSEKLLYDQLLLKADKDELTVNTSSGVTTINLKGTGGSATQTTVYTPVMVNELLGRAVGEAVIATFRIPTDGTYDFCDSSAESELQLIVIDGKGYLSAQGISATASDSLSVIYVFKNARIIPDAAFKGLDGLNSAELLSLHIPSFVHEIGSGTCAGCTRLTSIDCEAMTPPTVSADSFDGITMANVGLTIHNIVKDDYENNGTHWAGVGTISTY